MAAADWAGVADHPDNRHADRLWRLLRLAGRGYVRADSDRLLTEHADPGIARQWRHLRRKCCEPLPERPDRTDRSRWRASNQRRSSGLFLQFEPESAIFAALVARHTAPAARRIPGRCQLRRQPRHAYRG